MLTKRCTKCGIGKPATRENFGGTPKGNLRGECRECVNARQKTPEAREKHRKRAEQRRERGGSDMVFTEADKRRLYKKQSGFCLCCAREIASLADAEVDHIQPVAKDGTNA